MQLTKDALLLIQETARKATQPQKIDVPGDGRTAWYWQGGDLHDIDVKPQPRNHHMQTLGDLIAYAEAIEESSSSPLMLWHGIDGVVLVLDDGDRRDRVTFTLHFTQAWHVLQGLDGEPRAYDQKAFLRLLRQQFGVGEDVVQKFRKLDWESTLRQRSETRTGRESVGRDIEAQVCGTADLPEELYVNVPIYREAGERALYTVKLLLEYDVQQARIVVSPEPEVLVELLDAHQATIAERLEKALSIPCYYGAP